MNVYLHILSKKTFIIIKSIMLYNYRNSKNKYFDDQLLQEPEKNCY